MCHHHVTLQNSIVLIKYPNGPAPTSRSCHVVKDLKLKLENNPAVCHFSVVVNYYRASFVVGETEAWRESNVLGILQILQPHQARGKSHAAPSHDPVCTHTAPGKPCSPFLPWFTGPGSSSSAAQFLIETKGSCKN